MTPGLYQEIEKLRTRQRKQLDVAADTDEQPHIRHGAKVNAEMLSAEILTMTNAILENVDMASQLQGQLNRLTISKHQSRHRFWAIALLEQAQDRLRRELGEKPAAQV